MSGKQVRHVFVLSSQRRRALLGSGCAFGLAAALALGMSPASAKVQQKPPQKGSERISKLPFGEIPKGPLEIFVSIDQQKLHLYSDGVHVADTSVATGVPSLPTPLGVFSVIQKQVFHRSNIYSGAPMPFMQRITWSGVALHEGESIGHRASHGCIRMPRDFAIRLYQLTRLGARVIVADGELKPSTFADPRLFVHKVVPPTPLVPVAAAAQPVRSAQASDNAKTTDAVDAKLIVPSAPDAGVLSPGAAATNPVAIPQSGDITKATDAIEAKPDTSGTAGANAPIESAATFQSAKTAQSGGDDTKTTEALEANPDAPAVAAGAADPSKSVLAQTPPVAPTPAVTQAPPVDKTAAVAPSSESLRGTDASPALTAGATADAIPVPPAKPAEAIQSTADRKTPISVFVSRKTGRIYVRQNFEPMFDAAITIEHPEQPIGTHVFTALDYLSDGSTFRWDVVSLPAAPPKLKRGEARDERSGRHVRGRRGEEIVANPAAHSPPPETPADALARIEIPQNIIDRISEMMVPGSSLIVSDQGLGDETGEGTDFVVVTR